MDVDSVWGRGETERDDEEDIAMTSGTAAGLASNAIDLAAPSLDANEGMSEVIGVDGGVETLPLFEFKSEEKML